MSVEVDRSVIGREFDRTVFGPISREEIVEYSEACGEPCAEDQDGLTAPSTFVVSLRGRRFMPHEVTKLGRAGLDAGKDIEFGVPVRVGDVLTSVSAIHDIYEKTGRSGRMGFLVLRTVITNQDDEAVAVVDQRMMFR
jgi:hypothetical protein